ncbi:MAG: Outer rane efflux protein [Acidobacteria bacterium]|nr:Outer rane efflux protein [Acidobacteriota bacterium]
MRIVVCAALLSSVAATLLAQTVAPLSLREAEARALQSHPQVLASEFVAQATAEVTREARSAYFPAVYGSVTGAEAKDGSRIAAGGLNNPIILDRVAGGVSFSQLLTDFGRTSDLVQTASLRAEALRQNVATDRADVLLRVDRAYFSALRAQAILRVAQETVRTRQLVADQVGALAESNLKSGLDVSFAKVNVSEAQLMLLQARNDQASAFAALAAALGQRDAPEYALSEEILPPAPPADEAELVAQALRERPDVAAERLVRESAMKFADAERALSFPTVSALGAAGLAPYGQVGLNSNYSAIGINVTVPLANGSLFSARHAEASLRARAESERLRDLENRVTRDVRVALLEAQSGFQRLDLTNQLLEQASQAEDLADARYNLGLSSIVELTQAQLNKTRAEIEQASARYDYQARMAALRYQQGTLR